MTLKTGIGRAVLALALGVTLGSSAMAERIKRIYLDEDDYADAAQYTVVSLAVLVPETLRVSEARNYYPDADIVWRGDPPGNRYQQVDDLVTAAMQSGVAGLNGPQQVEVVVQIARFHCLTERARAVTGGFYGIEFYIAVRDPVTHVDLRPPVFVDAKKVAYGRNAAILQEAMGNGQKEVISQHLAKAIRLALEQSEP